MAETNGTVLNKEELMAEAKETTAI